MITTQALLKPPAHCATHSNVRCTDSQGLNVQCLGTSTTWALPCVCAYKHAQTQVTAVMHRRIYQDTKCTTGCVQAVRSDLTSAATEPIPAQQQWCCMVIPSKVPKSDAGVLTAHNMVPGSATPRSLWQAPKDRICSHTPKNSKKSAPLLPDCPQTRLGS